VIDQGPNIPEEFKTRIFQKFSQDNTHAHDKHVGTGLGLNITKMLVEKFDGSINFTTSDSNCTTLGTPISHDICSITWSSTNPVVDIRKN